MTLQHLQHAARTKGGTALPSLICHAPKLTGKCNTSARCTRRTLRCCSKAWRRPSETYTVQAASGFAVAHATRLATEHECPGSHKTACNLIRCIRTHGVNDLLLEIERHCGMHACIYAVRMSRLDRSAPSIVVASFLNTILRRHNYRASRSAHTACRAAAKRCNLTELLYASSYLPLRCAPMRSLGNVARHCSDALAETVCLSRI